MDGDDATATPPNTKKCRHNNSLQDLLSSNPPHVDEKIALQNRQKESQLCFAHRMSPSISLCERDQFAALAMSAHPRCGRNIATATSTTSFGNAFALAVGLVWGWCRDSAARFFYLAFFDHGASCVVGFKVSPLLGSIRGELECWWEDNPECMFLSLNHRRNAMEFCIPSLNYNVKNFETGRTQCVVRSCDFPQYCGSNGKWWVYFDYNSLWIHNLELTGSCAPTGDEVGAAHKVKLPRMFFYEGTSVFFNNLNPDEGILCNCGSTGHFYEVELTVIQLEESWAHKEFMQVNETEWHCDPDIASFTDALVLKKSSGIVSFIVAIEKNGRFPWLKEVYPMLPPKLQIVNIDEGCTTYDEGTPLHSVLHRNDPIFEIWDVNNLSGSLRVVEVPSASNCCSLFFEGGLMFSTTYSLAKNLIALTEPSSGTQILSLSTNLTPLPSHHSFLI